MCARRGSSRPGQPSSDIADRAGAASPIVSESTDGAVLSILATPKAGANAVGPVEGDAIRVRVTAAAADGAANEAIVRLLAEQAALPKSKIKIVSGQAARRKRVLFAGVGAEDLRNRLGLQRKPSNPTSR